MYYKITHDAGLLEHEEEYDRTLSYVGILDEKDTVMGLAAYSIEGDILYLYYLIVREPFRENRLGSVLIQELKQLVAERELNGIIGQFVAEVKLNSVIECFLVKHGFALPTISETSFCIPISELPKTRLMTDPAFTKTGNAFSTIEQHNIRAILKIYSKIISTSKLKELKTGYAPGLSLVSNDNNSSVLYSIQDKDIVLELAQTKSVSTSISLLALLYNSIHQLTEKYTSYNNLYICAINDASMKLINKLIRGADYTVTNLINTYVLL